ncbi:hypothetical protein BKA69DRAFT_1089491 [Paraphysoderma sedebokerense]|nr:hypothetical protein BKA69DRAFT_1089491 [Paraphysoderma sedebokerense]
MDESNSQTTQVPLWKRIFSLEFYYQALPSWDLVASPWLSPTSVLFVRILLALWLTICLPFVFVVNGEGGRLFIYFTNLSFFGLIVTSWVSQTLLYISARYRNDPTSKHLKNARFLRFFATFLYSTSFPYHLLVPLVYWVLLAEAQPTPLRTFVNFARHGLDFVVIFIYFATSSLSMTWPMMIPTITLAIFYMFYVWIWYGTGSGWAYNFLDWNRPASNYMYPLLVVGFFLAYFFGMSMHWLRAKVLGGSKLTVGTDEDEHGEDMEMGNRLEMQEVRN